MMIADGLHIWPIDANTMYKGDSDEVGRQGQWIVDQDDNPALPKVYRNRLMSYDMERLNPLPSRFINHRTTLALMFIQLHIWVWGPPVVTEFAPLQLDTIIRDILEKNVEGTTSPLSSLAHRISWDNLPRTLTHGNCTFDNTMVRPDTHDLVFISPKPATPAVPDMRAVDLGRILQSIMGFEEVRYNDTHRGFHAHHTQLRGLVQDDNEWLATLFWCVVHLLRCLPRTTDKQLKLDIWKLLHNTIELGKISV